MRYFFTAAILMIALFAKGQIVNIPDSNFKWKLLNYQSTNLSLPTNYIDANNDGEIQETEALAITGLDLYNDPSNQGSADRPIRDLTGIKSFNNLRRLNLTANAVHNIDLSNMINLDTIVTSRNSIFNINLNGCHNLKTVNLTNEPATALILHDMPNLAVVFLANGIDDMQYISIKNCPALNYIAWPNFNGLTHGLVELSNAALESISGIPYGFTANTTVMLDNMSRLKTFNVYPSIDSLIIKNCDSLVSIDDQAFGAQVNYIKVDNCRELTRIGFFQYTGESLDIINCPKLSLLGNNNSWAPNLKSLNIKNGIFTEFSIPSVPSLRYICADESEIINTINKLAAHPWNTNFTVNSYCSFIPGGTYNTIKGNTRVDINNNGCDSSDRNIKNVLVKLTDTTGQTYVTSSNEEGKYSVYTYKGNFTLSPYFAYPYFSINPSSENLRFDTANNLIAIRDFCIQPNGTHNDLEITFLPTWPVARPGFDAAYTLVYRNRGTTTLSGNVAVNFDNSKINFVSASENVATQNTGQLTWNYNNLQPFESKTINVTFNLLPPPVNNIGDTIIFLSAITPSANDETAFDNSFILPQTVIGSFDPNDKQCLEGSKIDISKIGEYLHYQIRFQNEGTDTAFNIVVADILSDKLDWNSFEFIGSSHTADVKLTNNKLEFIFQNINLPYKAIDEPGSNGWIAFKIKPKPSVVIGDSLNNNAAIYFDFNLPVITNTATTIVSSASTPVPVKLEYFSVNKKENTNQLNWKASCTYGNAAFIIERSDDGINFKSIGNINATAVRCQLPFNFTDNNPVAGKNYYRLKITDADGKSFYSKTLVVGNGKAGIEITAVANNIVYLSSNKQQTVTMKIIATDGRAILNQKQTVGAGSNNISLQMKSAAKGIYTLIVYTEEGGMITKRFLK